MYAKLTVLAVIAISALSISAQFSEDAHYQVIPTSFDTLDVSDEKVVVTEMFSYSCIHCFNLEKQLEEWAARQPDDVQFEREHVVFSQTGLNLAKAYYAAEELGVTDKVHEAIFSAIHINRLRMNREDLLVRLFEGRGEVEATKFQEVFNGFNVNNRIRKSDALVRAWRIEGTPTLIVDGRFIAKGPAIRSNTQVFEVVDFLVDKVRNERKGTGGAGS